MNKKISVIIPFYSNKEWLIEAIESVLRQTYNNFEILIINDGSAEDISDLMDRYNNQIIFVNQQNKGAANARNNGIKLSKGEYIAFLDSDDLWLPDKLENQVTFMEKYHYKWSHTDYLRFWNKSEKKERNVKCPMMGSIIPMCLVWNPIATPCVMIAKSVFSENINLRFAEDKKVGEDSFLWQQIGKKFELGYLPRTLTKVRIRGKNAAFQAYLQLKYRGESISNLREYKNDFTSAFIYKYFLVNLVYCNVMTKAISGIANLFNVADSSFEFFYKIAYLFPFVNFKIIRKLL